MKLRVGDNEIDLSFTTATALVRAGDAEYEAVMAWIVEQRTKRAQRTVEVDERAKKIAAEQAPTIAAEHAQQAAWAKAERSRMKDWSTGALAPFEGTVGITCSDGERVHGRVSARPPDQPRPACRRNRRCHVAA